MSNMVDAFVEERKSQGMTAKTITWHKNSLKKFTEYLEESDQLVMSDWEVGTLRGFIRHLQQTELSPASIRTCVNSVWAFVRWLYEEDLIEKNLAEKAKKPRVPKKQKSSMTMDELSALIETASKSLNGVRDVAILYIMFDTGMRAQEVCNLTVGDFHQKERLLLVREGKGQKDRVVPIDSKTALMILKYLAKHRPMNLKKDAPLFVSKRNTHLTPSGLHQLIRRIAAKAGIEGVHPHRFRHSSALHFLRNGGDALTLQRILGHTTLDMTNKYVAMLSDDISRVHATASPVKNLK